MSDLWESIDVSRWRETPATVGRVATEDDVKSGNAVFYVNGASRHVDMRLPRAAIQHFENGSSQRVVVIQAEYGPSGIILGVRPLDGGNGVCVEDEVEYVSDFDAS